MLLKKSTEVVVHIGPLVDATDMVTVETALTLGSGYAELYTAGATSATAIHANTWAHISGGVYRLTLTSSNTSIVGPLLIHIHPVGAVPIVLRADVLGDTAFNTLTTGSALAANVTQINSDATAAANLASSALGIQTLTVQTGATTTSIPTNLTQTDNNFFAGRTLVITSGTLKGQATTISAYNGTTKYLTVAALTEAPGTAITAVIV
ncbi:hypothetical protein UFOVP469_7 [uncultured Caudovirales phage]|uniref:Uncharacterized protein n=1 Tax=uncultured Caudovirales phage TaxID=2100421 RepID=A0A6J5MG68_9CAUD|nr:hypothetical protein UFOVP469_7 [uncultured Caudovirales phage]CAB4190109.1 hypothetical protein UFOVP1200_37 [uncultured Caudovirales phage]